MDAFIATGEQTWPRPWLFLLLESLGLSMKELQLLFTARRRCRPEERAWNAAGACGGLTGLIVPVFASSLHAFAMWSSNLFSWGVLARFAMTTHSAARSTYSSAFPISVS